MADVLLNQGEKVVLNNSGAANIIITNPVGSANMNLQNPGGKIAFPDAIDSAHALLIGGSHLLWRDTSLILRTDARFETPMLIARGTVTIDGNETDAYIRLERSVTAKWQIGRFGTGDDLDFLKDSGTGWMKLTYAGGQLQLPQLGSGAGILLGGDANLYRSAANVLKTDDSLEVNVNLTVAGNIVVAGTVDGVDVSAHAANVNAHHAQTHSDADHTLGQYALLTGRAAGQILCGGTLANDYIQIDSTSHATKGLIRFHNAQNSIDANGNLTLAGNLRVLRSTGDPIPLMYLGRAELRPPAQSSVPERTNYFFWHSRLNKNGWYWGGINTFRHPDTYPQRVVPPDPVVPSVEVGYGYFPFRNAAKHYLIEADGSITTDNAVVSPFLYFQKPKRTDLWDGVEKDPYSATTPINYDSDRHPYIDLGQQTSLASPFPDEDATQIAVVSSTGFVAHDEILIDGTSATGTPSVPAGPRSEINEIANISGTTWTLKRGTKKYDSGVVKKVRELGGVRTNKDAVGLNTYITRVKTASPAQDYMIFYDAEAPSGKRLARLVTSAASVNNMKIDSAESAPEAGPPPGGSTVRVTQSNPNPSPYSLGPNSTANLDYIALSPGVSFSTYWSYLVVLTPRNVVNSWGVSLSIDARSTTSFSVIARNDHPTLTAQFYIQWIAIGT